MRAWKVDELGEPAAVLHEADAAAPEPGPGDVGIDVAAAGLNFPDVLMCRGEYQVRPELPFTPGSEVAGTISAVGDGVEGFRIGDRVLAIPQFGHGSFADRTVASAATTYPIPDELDWAAAASMHITYQTGHLALHHRARLRPDETLLVHAGAGGVGSAAIQLGLAAGARVFATAGGPEKVEICRKLGADPVIDYRSEDFVEVVKAATDGRGVDVVYDPVGGDTFDRSRKCIAWEGRILVIGFTSGRIPDAPANHVLIKNYAVVGVHWGMYNLLDPERVRRTHDELVRLALAGKIAPLVSEEIRGAELPDALDRLASRRTWGKVVWRP